MRSISSAASRGRTVRLGGRAPLCAFEHAQDKLAEQRLVADAERMEITFHFRIGAIPLFQRPARRAIRFHPAKSRGSRWTPLVGPRFADDIRALLQRAAEVNQIMAPGLGLHFQDDTPRSEKRISRHEIIRDDRVVAAARDGHRRFCRRGSRQIFGPSKSITNCRAPSNCVSGPMRVETTRFSERFTSTSPPSSARCSQSGMAGAAQVCFSDPRTQRCCRALRRWCFNSTDAGRRRPSCRPVPPTHSAPDDKG